MALPAVSSSLSPTLFGSRTVIEKAKGKDTIVHEQNEEKIDAGNLDRSQLLGLIRMLDRRRIKASQYRDVTSLDAEILYTERDSKIGISAAPKPRGSTIVSRPHISNIGRLTIVKPRELSRQPKSDF